MNAPTRQRIGILGGGAAGLAAAWLLEHDHDVTLFEQADRLGGHAFTVTVEQDGERVGIDAGFEFFSERMFPRFTRLLNLLGVPLRHYPMTATFYTPDNRSVRLLPPLRDGRLVWGALKPRPLLDLLQFGYALQCATPLMRARDTSVTLGQFLAGLPLTRAFKRDFMAPFLLAGWCVEPEEFLHFSAYDVLSYSYWHRPTGLAPVRWTEVVGGTQTYVRALAQALTQATVKTACAVVDVTRRGAGFCLRAADGSETEVDHLILATNARVAGRLLETVDGTEDLRRSLAQIEYFKTTIAVHGDARLMPADRRYWSVVNTRYDGRHSANTVWKAWKSRALLLRSWVTYEARLPEPLYELVTFEHPKVNARYFEAQRSLAPCQGQGHVWLAGAYVRDVDCHESAVMSALDIARRLAPGAARLRASTDKATDQRIDQWVNG